MSPKPPMTPKAKEERAWVAAAKQGDKQAYQQFRTRCDVLVGRLRWALRQVVNKERWEDLDQELELGFWTGCIRFKPRKATGSPQRYCLQWAEARGRAFARKNGKRADSLHDSYEQKVESGWEPEEPTYEMEPESQVDLSGLAAIERKVLQHRVLQDDPLSQVATAKRLKKSTRQVRAIEASALEKVRTILLKSS